MPTASLADDHTVVLAIGPRDRTAVDLYSALLDALDMAVPDDKRTNPRCCDKAGAPPATQTPLPRSSMPSRAWRSEDDAP